MKNKKISHIHVFNDNFISFYATILFFIDIKNSHSMSEQSSHTYKII